MDMSTRKKEAGLLSLEASIALTIFIFLMLFMYSFFVFFEARNQMGHAVLAATNSLAVDAQANANLGETDTLTQVFFNVYGGVTNDDNDFTDYRMWYDDATVTDDEENTTLSTTFSDVITNRFIAYLTGGDETKTDTVLDRLNIVGGMDGLDFSGSYVADNNLYVVLKYTIEYEFNVFDLGTLELEQSACSKLWKEG